MIRPGARAAALFLGALLGMTCLVGVTPLAAQDAAPLPDAGQRDEAAQLVEEGVSLREQGRDEEAVGVFRRAYAIDDTPRIRAQLGLALLASGQFVEAYDTLEGALATEDPWIETHRAALWGSFESAGQHVGLVEVMGGEPGASVSVNGARVGQMPLPRAARAATGRAVIDVALEGYRPFSAEVVVQAGQTSRVRVELLPPLVEGSDPSRSDWFVPLIIVGAVLVVGGVATGLAIGLQQPSYERSDVGGVVMTLQGAW